MRLDIMQPSVQATVEVFTTSVDDTDALAMFG